MAADPLDVISLSAAKAAINMAASTTEHDTVLEGHITAVSRRFDEVIGPVVNRAVTEYHDGGDCLIRPRQTPLSAVTTLTEASGTSQTVLTAETFATQPGTAYLLDVDGSYAHRCRIIRRAGGMDYPFPYGRRNVELVYVAGRAATTADVDARIRDAAGMVLRRLWRREAGSWTQSADFFEASDTTQGIGFFKVMDSVVAEFLADEMKPPLIA